MLLRYAIFLKNQEDNMKLSQIKQVAIIGAGIMGHGFAQIFAQKGYPVFLYDIDGRILERALTRIAANLDTFIENGLIRKKEKAPVLNRITLITDLEAAVRNVDFVLEAVPEIMDLKKEIFKKLDSLRPSPRHSGLQHLRLEHHRNGLGHPPAG